MTRSIKYNNIIINGLISIIILRTFYFIVAFNIYIYIYIYIYMFVALPARVIITNTSFTQRKNWPKGGSTRNKNCDFNLNNIFTICSLIFKQKKKKFFRRKLKLILKIFFKYIIFNVCVSLISCSHAIIEVVVVRSRVR
jgi:hypothetical protein